MAYFSNGTEGSLYEQDYCSKCVHRNGADGKSGCAVWLAHLLFNYDLCNSETPGKTILDMLIPVREDGFAGECAMFHEGEAVTDTTDIPEKAVHPVQVMPAMREWARARNLIP